MSAQGIDDGTRFYAKASHDIFWSRIFTARFRVSRQPTQVLLGIADVVESPDGSLNVFRGSAVGCQRGNRLSGNPSSVSSIERDSLSLLPTLHWNLDAPAVACLGRNQPEVGGKSRANFPPVIALADFGHCASFLIGTASPDA